MTSQNLNLTIDELTVKNFATFDDQTIRFNDGFNAIIGETGSGKSLILDALQLILGQRADKKLIRKDCEFAVVEASFTTADQNMKLYFDKIGFPIDDNQVVIKRVLYRTGKTKSFLNYQNCSLSTLTDFSRQYIDLVGQFENQKLLSEDYQIQLVDSFAGNHRLYKEFKKAFTNLSTARTKLNNAISNNQERSQKLDYINFQIEELEKLNPSQLREGELIQAKAEFQNFETDKQDIALLNNIFEGENSGNGIISQLSSIERVLNNRIIDQDSINAFTQAQEILNDINYKLNKSLDSEFDEEEYENVLNELDLYQRLKRKFGVETQGLVELFNEFKLQRDELQNIEDKISELQASVVTLTKQARELAEHLHTKRCEYATKLSKLLTKEVQALNMKGATISIELKERVELSASGLSEIAFMAETNPGEGFYKVKDIASGGELSRILLSLRKVLSAKDSISIFLFDEIDTGIGGETAQKVGQVLRDVADDSQVIAITHLPQIAIFADKLVMVSKEVVQKEKAKRTVSVVKELTGNDLQTEVQAMSRV